MLSGERSRNVVAALDSPGQQDAVKGIASTSAPAPRAPDRIQRSSSFNCTGRALGPQRRRARLRKGRPAPAGRNGLEHRAGGIESPHQHEVRRDVLGQLLRDAFDRLIDLDVTARLTPDAQQQLHAIPLWCAAHEPARQPQDITEFPETVECDGKIRL